MKKPKVVESINGSIVMGVVRTLGFFGLIFVIVPIHSITLAIGRLDPLIMPRLFHLGLIKLMGFKVRVHGSLDNVVNDKSPTLFVSNHSSYLDVPVLGSIIPGAFVAKSEVSKWPLIGTLAKLQNTVFVERRSSRAAVQRDGMTERLQKGDSLILFPEGTSSDGQRTLPFKSSLFSVAAPALPNGNAVKVQPITIICTEIGGIPIGRAWRPLYAWYGDMTFVNHLWNVFKIGGFTVDVVLHAPVTINNFDGRKALSDYCQLEVAKGVEKCITGRIHERLPKNRR